MTDPLSEQELAELERLAEAATPEPWAISGFDGRYVRAPYGDLLDSTGRSLFSLDRLEDAAFIAAAREAVPRLIKSMREARAEETRWRNAAHNAIDVMADRISHAEAERDALSTRVAELESKLAAWAPVIEAAREWRAYTDGSSDLAVAVDALTASDGEGSKTREPGGEP